MRNASPFFSETLKQMADDGVQRALGFILSSHRTEASWERYRKISPMRAELGQPPETTARLATIRFLQTWAELFNGLTNQADNKSDSAGFYRAQPADGNGRAHLLNNH
jgi:protoheme ferro-lyase